MEDILLKFGRVLNLSYHLRTSLKVSVLCMNKCGREAGL
jgi:hypothetical protein